MPIRSPDTDSRLSPVPLVARGLLLAVLLPGLAGAAGFTPPEGCRLTLTVQNRSCTVSQHFVCEADPAGDQHVTNFGSDGPSFHSHIDAETRWLELTDLRSGLRDVLAPEAADHASFSTLLREGRDDFDFWTVSSDGERLRHIGRDVLTGEAVEIDGQTLELTNFDLRTFSSEGELLIAASGQQFVSRAHGRFYGGIERSEDWTGTVTESNDSPISFAGPGDPGFGATTPLFGCEMQMVRAGGGDSAS